MQQPPSEQWQQNTSWGSSPQWQHSEPLPPQYPQQMPPQLWHQQPNYTQSQSYYPPQQPLSPQQNAPPPNELQQPPVRPSQTLSRITWILVGVAIGLVFGLILGSSYGRSASTNTSNTTTQAAAQVTSQPTQVATQAAATPTPSHFTVGGHVTSGIWVLTVNSAKTNTGDEFDIPKAGNIYMLINFTAKNTDTNNRDMSPNYFTLRDNQGNTYDLAYITVPSEPRGTVVAGQQLRGDLSYEIPKSLHLFIMQFDPPDDIDNNQIVQWTIQV